MSFVFFPFFLQYTWTLETESSPAVEALFSLAKDRLPIALEAKFAEFPASLIETHGKDLTVSADPSRSGTPAPSALLNAPASAATAANSSSTSVAPPAKNTEPKKSLLNTTTVKVEGTFMAGADTLFGLLTEESKIPLWTHASAKVCFWCFCLGSQR